MTVETVDLTTPALPEFDCAPAEPPDRIDDDFALTSQAVQALLNPTHRRDRRLGLRVTAVEEQLIRQAAAATGRSVTEFVVLGALGLAQQVLDRADVRVHDSTLTRLQRELEEPARTISQLKALAERMKED